MSNLQIHFIKPEEARDYIYSEILRLIDRYTDKAITFMDVYYRIMAEPLLSIEEKRQIVMSPTRETILKLWKGKKPQYAINGVAIPLDAVITVESKAKVYRYVQEYPFLKPIISKPVALGVMSALKCISMFVKGMRRSIVIPDLPWKHEDALATIVVMARLANVKLITNMPVVLKEEINTEINPRLLTLDASTTINISAKNISRIFEPALRKFIEDNRFEDVAKTLYGIDVYKLERREDWWNYLGFNSTFNQELFEKAIRSGIPAEVAKKIATWKVSSIFDVVKLAREIMLMIPDQYYFMKVLEFLASNYNYRTEVLMALLDGAKIIKEDCYNNKGKRFTRKYLIKKNGEIIYLDS